MPTKFTLLVLALMWACRPDAVQCEEPVRRTEDVIYGRKTGLALTMDAFQPAKPNGCGLLFLGVCPGTAPCQLVG